MTSQQTLKRMAPLAVALGMLLLGACGGSGGTAAKNVASIDSNTADDAAKSTAAEKIDPEQASLDLAKCMRANGVDVPDPSGDGGGRIVFGMGARPDDDALAKAQAACKKEREALQGSVGAPPGDVQDRMLEMARCMRKHGVDMPDPVPGEGGRVSMRLDRDDIEDPKFEAAQATCRKEAGLPEGGMVRSGAK